MAVNASIAPPSQPALQILLDDAPLLTVSSARQDLLSVHLYGSKADAEPAHLHVDGGRFGGGADFHYLTWWPESPLLLGQTLTLRLLNHGESTRPGQTLSELMPDKDLGALARQVETELTDEAAAALALAETRGQRWPRERIAFSLDTSTGTRLSGATLEQEFAFGFNLMWESRRPDCAHVSLYTSGLPGAGGPMDAVLNHRYQEMLALGEELRLSVLA